MATFARKARLNPEKLLKLKIGQHLQPREREVLIAALFNKEGALAWGFSHIGRFIHDVAPPQVIKTIKHNA